MEADSVTSAFSVGFRRNPTPEFYTARDEKTKRGVKANAIKHNAIKQSSILQNLCVPL